MTDFSNDAGTGVVTADGFTGLRATDIPAATEAAIGGVLMAGTVALAAGATPTKAEFDALIAALIASGAMAAA